MMVKRNGRLVELVQAFPGKRIAVIGDLMLDVYVWGRATRISPEAPVPIVQVKNRTQCLGGAANVMRNVATLGGSSEAFGMIGDDSNGKAMLGMLNDYHIGTTGVMVDPARRTTEKQRIIAGTQQLLRIDYEDLEEAPATCRQGIVDRVKALLRDRALDAVIFEDYAKGLLESGMAQEIVDAARAAGVIVALDPNPKHPLLLKGLTVMKPNRAEAFALAGRYSGDTGAAPEQDAELKAVADFLMAEWHPEYLLISLAAQGLALFDRHGGFTVIPTLAREVFDVSGAGDTVIAAYTLALTAGATGVEAARIANHAAGIVVGKVGTVPVAAAEVLNSLKTER